tara:strand:- start:12592 stop:13164 length:573 start_codon:yes stop_codon:yes gene_type:complete
MKSDLLLIPNIITISRLICIPIIVGLYLTGSNELKLIALIIFLYAAISDFLDGYLARKLDQSSLLGEVIDPIADKLLVIIIYMLFLTDNFINMLTATGILIIVSREIVIITLREIFAHKGMQIKVISLSKTKTAFQLISIIMLFLASIRYPDEIIFLNAANIILWLAVILSIASLYQYLINIKKGKTHET